MTDRWQSAAVGGVLLTRGAFLRRLAGLALAAPTLLSACTAPAPQAALTSAPQPAPTSAPQAAPTSAPAAPTTPPTVAVTVAAPTPAATAATASQLVVSGVVLPTYVPAKGPKPDLPSTGAGVDDAYLS